jgi:hypothetical protein
MSVCSSGASPTKLGICHRPHLHQSTQDVYKADSAKAAPTCRPEPRGSLAWPRTQVLGIPCRGWAGSPDASWPGHAPMQIGRSLSSELCARGSCTVHSSWGGASATAPPDGGCPKPGAAIDSPALGFLSRRLRGDVRSAYGRSAPDSAGVLLVAANPREQLHLDRSWAGRHLV